MCLLKSAPQWTDFLKSATGQLPICACRNVPSSLQIFWNLPLDSYLSFLHALSEIPPPPSLQIFRKSATGQLPRLPSWNLPLDRYLHMLSEISPICRFTKICHWTVTSVTYICLQKFPTWFGDFPKSATVQLPKLLICACRNSPPVCRFSEICHWTVT